MTKTITTTLALAEYEMIKTLGRGKVSKGLRLALDIWLESKEATSLCGATASVKKEVSNEFGEHSRKEAATFLKKLTQLSATDEWVKKSKVVYCLCWDQVRAMAAIQTLLATQQIEQRIVKTKTTPSVQFRVREW